MERDDDRQRAFAWFMDTGFIGAYLLYAAIRHREEGMDREPGGEETCR